jgi:cytochrome c5
VRLRVPLCVAFVGIFIAALATPAQNPPAQQAQRSPAKMKTATVQSTTDESAEGEKRFEIHCGRCHVPPEDLSPREARAVIRQMRVRANLTAEDERLILKYLAP